MKIFSGPLELRLLKTVLKQQSQKTFAHILGQVREDSFHTRAAKEIYLRSISLLREKGKLPSWAEILYDPVLSDDTRDILKDFKKRIFDSDEISGAVDKLMQYRQARLIFHAAQEAIEGLNKDKVDTIKLIDEMTKKLTMARINSRNDTWFTHFGSKDKSGTKSVLETLTHIPNYFIPTGIRAFDEQNNGMPRGTNFLCASTSGGGKSVLLAQIGEGMALNGAKVCIVPLEMSRREMTQRHLSRNSGVSIGKIINPISLSKKEIEYIKEIDNKFQRKIKKVGGLLTYFVPEEDMTIEEILMALKPFGYDAILIDYIGLLKGVDGDDQWRQLGNVTRFGKRYATINNMIIGFAAQLSDENVLRYSRAMQEHASLAWYWKFDDKARETHIVRVQQPKSRNLKSYDFFLIEDFDKMRFRDLDKDEEKAAKEDMKKETKSEKKTTDFKKSGNKKKTIRFGKSKQTPKNTNKFKKAS